MRRFVRELQDLKKEAARLRVEGDQRSREMQKEIRGRRRELSVMRQCTELKGRTKELHTRQAEMALEGQELTRCHELEMQLEKV